MRVIYFCLVLELSNWVGNYKVQAKLPNVKEGLDTILKSWYPEDTEFNESCVSEGCPALKNFRLCHNRINITILHAVLNTAVGCMRKPICGILIDTRPTPDLTTTTDEWLPGMEINGTIWTIPGVSYLLNISNIEYELVFTHDQVHQLPLLITMLIPNMRASGIFKLDMSVRTVLPSLLGQALSVSIPQAKYDVDIEYVSTMSINHSATHSHLDIKLLNPIVKSHVKFCGIEMPGGFPNILTLIHSMTQNILEKSSWAVRKAAFLEKYFESAIRTVSKNC